MFVPRFFFTVVFYIIFIPFALQAVVIPNDFIEEKDPAAFREIFTVNVGIMRFKKNGNLIDIKPLDGETIVKTIRSTIDNVPVAKLNQKDALIKTIKYIETKNTTSKDKLAALRNKIYSASTNNETRTNKLIASVLLNMDSITDLSTMKNRWFENYQQPVYTVKTYDVIDYKFNSYKNISEQATPTYDYLITGEIEKSGSNYLITIFVYSTHRDKIIYKTAFITEKDSISINTEKKLKPLCEKIFNIKYGELSIKTGEETEIYINSSYIGKNKLDIPFVTPGTYLITLKEPDAEPYSESLIIEPNEIKEFALTPEFKKQLQPVFINIEPAGTKIFINSQYKGTTPFRLMLPAGEFVLTTKTNDFHIDYRYTFAIDEIKDEEIAISFHLMSKDVSKFLKLKKTLYYTAFWSFTLNMTVTIPTVIISTMYYNMPLQFGNATENVLNNSKNVDAKGKIIEDQLSLTNTAEILRFTAIGLGINLFASLVWLFYTLSDYLNTLEKKDFIPILHYYSSPEESKITIGGVIPIKAP